MNIMFCGDSHAEDGILITTLSLLKNTSTPCSDPQKLDTLLILCN